MYRDRKTNHARTVLITSLLIVAAFVVLTFFKTGKVSADDPITSVTTSVGDQNQSLLSPEQARLINQINTLKLDSSIFTNSTFLSLVDNTTDLGFIAAGRPNPFAPVGAVVTTPTPTPTKSKSSKTPVKQ